MKTVSADFRPGRYRHSAAVETFCARNGNGEALPWGVLVKGKLLRKKNGVGRSFKTEKAALKAAEKSGVLSPIEAAEYRQPCLGCGRSVCHTKYGYAKGHMCPHGVRCRRRLVATATGGREFTLRCETCRQRPGAV